ncbi:hypothetical protein [Bradyrhizobium sp. th.b2]|uniref:hypothetical protein n=1 Tax=Bradyrhizobium sp. th-b2 TaxID=172088 RepID=UPI0004286464|nr:hypothetical protein [Bradyrhizobium sp. th.b2]
MGRIRTIKPEFPQSESVGKLSRDARLLFIQLWTLSDDEGRLRASSRMLASLLYPYDDDANFLIDGWLDELEQREMVRRYVVEGSTYLEITNWLEHQKIDKPSKSRLPAFVENSRALANVREASATDLGPRTRTKEEDHSRSVEDRPASDPRQIDLEEAIAAKRSAEPSRFDEFWQAYPRRDGPNPRKPAETRFNSLVKTGLDPQMLIDAARKLASDEQARGNVGTRFIPQACTWLNQQRWSDHAAVAALQTIAGGEGEEFQLESAVKFYARTRVWSRHAGPEPGLTGCRASAELLAKHGLAPDGRKLPAVVAA